MIKNNCQLCQDPLPVIEKLYKETDKWIILDCMTCHVPMIVWKEHTMRITRAIREDITEALIEVADKHFGKYKYYIDKKQRTVFDHLHWHTRPTGWELIHFSGKK